MKRIMLLTSIVVALAMNTSRAQVPIVQVYLDKNLTITNPHNDVCPPYGTLDTLYVAVSGFSAPIVDIEYSVNTYSHFNFYLEEFPSGFSGVGLTGEGVRVSFGGPIDASGKVGVETIVGAWGFCDCNSDLFPYIIVTPHSATGKIQAHRYPDLAAIEATGGYNSLCGVLPAEPTTWGKVKAMYR